MDGPLRRRLGAVVSVMPHGCPPGALEGCLRAFSWEAARALQWHGAKETAEGDVGCGFEAPDMYSHFTQSDEVEARWETLGEGGGVERTLASGTVGSLQVACSAGSMEGEGRGALAGALLAALAAHLRAEGGGRAAAVGVLLVTACERVPLMPCPGGLAAFHVDLPTGLPAARDALARAGLAVIPEGAVSPGDVGALRAMCTARVGEVEAAMAAEGRSIGDGDFQYAEICGRGPQRWDLLLLCGGELVAGGGEGDAALLRRVATEGAWEPLVRDALGEGYTWQASVVCSRPGAPAGKWHADGGHSRYSFGGPGGEGSAAAYALCVFVPLVDLAGPRRVGGVVEHGLGCTAFWPGSHRSPECLHLGSAAGGRLGAAVPGAPLRAGGALVYDYRLVHAGAPNQGPAAGAGEGDGSGGERPILQLTYCRQGYNDRVRNYGYEQLLCG